MTKLEQLIKELCPNGVEYKNLGKLFPFIRNGFVGTVTPFYTNAQNGIRYLQGTNIHNGIISDNEEFYITKEFHAKHSKNELKNDDILMVQSGHVGECAVVGEKYKGSNCHALIIMSNGGKCNSYYVRYYLQSSSGKRALEKITTGGTVKHILASKIKNVIIPVPPIEVQAEIVKILDEYTESVTALQQELEAELTARKKQYEYYRDLLLDFGVHGGETSECELRTLGTVIISLKTGLNPRQNFSLNENGSNLPYITGKDIYDNAINVTERTDRITTDALTLINKRANLESGLLLFASTGTGTVGRMAIIQEYNNDWGISETLYAIKVNENIILTSFLLHYLYSASAKSQFEPKISKGSVPHLKVKDLENVKVPIISIEEQTRIVSILDRFDKLCNDISEGLPTEIEARRKQYEYYRDKLLSFEERKNA